MQPEELFALVFVLGMFAGVFIIFMGLRQRSHQLEMQHRERMAMIERGQIPLDPPAARRERYVSLEGGRAGRSLSSGIIVVGIGLAMMTIISIAGSSPETGVGIGGAIAVLGGAFIVRSMVVGQERDRSTPPPPPSLPPRDL
jgi:hypothetical protein